MRATIMLVGLSLIAASAIAAPLPPDELAREIADDVCAGEMEYDLRDNLAVFHANALNGSYGGAGLRYQFVHTPGAGGGSECTRRTTLGGSCTKFAVHLSGSRLHRDGEEAGRSC